MNLHMYYVVNYQKNMILISSCRYFICFWRRPLLTKTGLCPWIKRCFLWWLGNSWFGLSELILPINKSANKKYWFLNEFLQQTKILVFEWVFKTNKNISKRKSVLDIGHGSSIPLAYACSKHSCISTSSFSGYEYNL